MSAIATSAPARASASASARPRPRLPPVTSAMWPERSSSIATRHEYLTSNHEPLDLRGALVDLEELGVAHELLDRVLLDVAVAAEDLDRVGGDLHCRIRAEALRERRVERGLAAVAVVEHPSGLPGEQAGGLDLGRHVRDEEVDALVHRDRDVEGDALLGVLHRVLEGRLSHPDGARRRARPGEIERLHRDLEAVALLAEPVGDGDDDVCERNAEVSVERWPILSRCFSTVTPGASIGTMNADSPRCALSGSVLAHTTVEAACH